LTWDQEIQAHIVDDRLPVPAHLCICVHHLPYLFYGSEGIFWFE
jgi:hypothetical protein